ncbi:MAG: hypothetical protein RLZZ519_55 [Bacteroidota bacterium]|jgi:hypothetical protein
MSKGSTQTNVSREVEEANAAFKRKILRIWGIIVLSVLGTAAIFAFVFAFPRLFHHQRFVTMDWVETDGKVVVVSLWVEETSSEDDGPSLEGYELRSLDPATGKELSKTYMEQQLDFVPSDPTLHLDRDGDVWVVQAQDNGQTSSFLKRLTLAGDGKFEPVGLGQLEGFAPISGFRGSKLSLRNKFNEFACFDAATEKLSDENCPWENSNPVSGSFFLVSKATGSTRSKLWHLKTDSVAPEPGISVGFVVGDRPMDGVHVLNDLASSQFQVTEERLAYYQSTSNPATYHFKCLTPDDYLVDAKLLEQDSMRVILKQPTDDPKVFGIQCINAAGQKSWRVELKLGDNPYNTIDVRSRGEQTILMDSEAFIVAINELSGKIIWEFRPEH